MRLIRAAIPGSPKIMSGPAITFTVRDDVSGRLGAIIATVKDRQALNEDMGHRAAVFLRDFFNARNVDGPRNKFDAPSSGFWGDIAQSVHDRDADAEGFDVDITDPRYVQKYFGGPITANDHLLAIPARSEAYNKSPRFFNNLRLIVFGHTGKMALVDYTPAEKRKPGEKRIGKTDERGLVFYWLVQAVNQAKDPNAFPPREAFIAALLDTAEKHVNRIKNES